MNHFDETAASLHSQAEQLLTEIAAIKEQIGRAKSAVHLTGDYSDADWYHAANRALRHKQQNHQRLLRMLAEVRNQRKAANVLQTATYERHFRSVAKEMLTCAVFQQICDEAKRRLDGGL